MLLCVRSWLDVGGSSLPLRKAGSRERVSRLIGLSVGHLVTTDQHLFSKWDAFVIYQSYPRVRIRLRKDRTAGWRSKTRTRRAVGGWCRGGSRRYLVSSRGHRFCNLRRDSETTLALPYIYIRATLRQFSLRLILSPSSGPKIPLCPGSSGVEETNILISGVKRPSFIEKDISRQGSEFYIYVVSPSHYYPRSGVRPRHLTRFFTIFRQSHNRGGGWVEGDVNHTFIP